MPSLFTQRASPLVASRTYSDVVCDVALRDERRAPRDMTISPICGLKLSSPIFEPGRKVVDEERTCSVHRHLVSYATARREERLVRHRTIEEILQVIATHAVSAAYPDRVTASCRVSTNHAISAAPAVLFLLKCIFGFEHFAFSDEETGASRSERDFGGLQSRLDSGQQSIVDASGRPEVKERR